MILAKISAKGQVNIPKSVRERLNVRAGDRIGFDLSGESVALVPVRAAEPSELRGAFRASRPLPDLGRIRQLHQDELGKAYTEGKDGGR